MQRETGHNYVKAYWIPYKLYACGDCLYLGRTHQQLHSRIKGHMNDALKGSHRLICQQIQTWFGKIRKRLGRKSITVIIGNITRSIMCSWNIRDKRCRPLLNVTTPKKEQKGKSYKECKKKYDKTPILKNTKKYVKNKPKQTKSSLTKQVLVKHSKTNKNVWSWLKEYLTNTQIGIKNI